MLKKINMFFEYFLLVLAFYVIFFTDYNPLLAISIFPVFFIFLYFHYYDKKHNMKIPPYLFTLGLIAIYLNIFGEFFFEFYYSIIFYDKILHFIISIYLVLVLNFLIDKKQKFKSFFIVMIVLGLGAVWEMFEFAIDSFSNGAIMQGVFIEMKELLGGLTDTMKDLFYALLGALIGLFIVKFKKIFKILK